MDATQEAVGECKDAIVCSSYPGAGASWITTIIQKVLSCSDNNDTAFDESKLADHYIPETGANQQDARANRKLANALKDSGGPRTICSNLPCDKLPEIAKIVYVYRDPRDIAVSQWQQMLTFDTSDSHATWTDFLAFFLSQGGKSGLWSDHFRSCQDACKQKRNILPLYYEAVLEDMEGAIKKIALFLGKQLGEQAIAKLAKNCGPTESSTDLDIQLLSSKDWKMSFTVAQSDVFDRAMYDEKKRLKLDMPYWPYSRISIDAAPLPPMYDYQGVLFVGRTVPFSRLRSVYNYSDIRDDDVFVWTYPKAGTHWVKEIVDKLPSKPDLERTRNFDLDFLMLEITPTSPFVDKKMIPQSLEELSECRSPRIIGTHLPFRMLPRLVQEGKAKVIYVYRDPRDMSVSGFHMLKAMQIQHPLFSWSALLERYMEGKVPFGAWWEHFYSCQQNRHRPNVLVLYYEEMKQDPKDAVRKIAAFLGKAVNEDDIDLIAKSCSIDEARKAKPQSIFVRKGISGDWKNYYTVLDNERFQEQLREKKVEYSLDIPY